MTMRSGSVAILAVNAASASILARALEVERGHRVPCFTEAKALTTFLRISPVDVVVFDADAVGAREIACGLPRHPRLPNPSFSTVALTRADPAFHRPLQIAGADMVLQKPIVPARLLAAIDRLLQGEQRSVANWTAPTPASAGRGEARPVRRNNVVPLFGARQGPL